MQPEDVGIGQLFDRIVDAVIVGDADTGRIALWNPAAERMFGYTAADVIGQPIDLVIPESYRSAHQAGLRRYRAGQKKLVDAPTAVQVPALRRDGQHIAVELSLTSLDVPAVGGRLVLALVRDVSERQRLQLERSARADAEAAGRRLAFLVEASTLLGASLDQETTFHSLTRLAVPELADWCSVDLSDGGGPARSIAASHADPTKEPLLRRLQHGYPPDPASDRPVSQVLRTGQPVLMPHIPDGFLVATSADAEHLQLRRDLGFSSVMVVPLQARGRLLGAITFASGEDREAYTPADLALAHELARRAALAVDNARLYQQAQTAAEEAQRAIGARDEFLSVAAHELKTPLTSLRGFAQLLERQIGRGGATDFAMLEHGLAVIGHQSTRLAALIDQLLDITRVDAGRLTLRLTRADLAVLVREAAARFQEVMERSGRKVTLRLDLPPACPADVDPARFEQVLRHVFDNAVRYGLPEGPIDVGLARLEGSGIVLTITDHGRGIPTELREALFHRYHQAHAREHASGLGLGLYLSRHIVALHGGSVGAEFPPDGGTCIIIRLPAPTA